MSNLFYFYYDKYLRMVWNTFKMVCILQVEIYIIGVNCIQTSELRNDYQMKTIVSFGKGRDSNILS